MKLKEMSKRYIKTIKPYIKNKYVIASSIFLIWILFFDNNSIISRSDLKQKYKQLIKSKEYYQSKIKTDSKKLNELKTNNKNLEKFAREQYFMKKPNEDIFIINEDKL